MCAGLRCRWVNRAVLCGLLPLVGCSESSGPASTAIVANKPAYTPFRLPDYARSDLATVREAAARDIEAGRAQAEVTYAACQALPYAERFRMPDNPEPYLSRNYADDALQFRRGRDLKGYQDSTADTGLARTRGEEFLTEYVKLAAELPDAKTHQQLLDLAQAALDAGSRDPIIAAYHGRVREATGAEHAPLIDLLEREIPRLQDPKVPALVRALITSWLWALIEHRKADELEDRRYLYAAMDAWIAFLADEADCPNQRVVWHQVRPFFGSLNRERQGEFLSGCWTNGQVHPWITHYMAGLHYHSIGWDHRGSGLASKVAEEAWPKFHENLRLSCDHLVRAWQIAPEHPEPPTMLIGVAMAGGDDRWTPRDWFREAVTAQIDYIPAYEKLEWALRPRWGGSYLQMLELASQCIGTSRYDTNVPTYAVTLLWNMQSEIDNPQGVAQMPGVVQVVRDLIKGLNRAIGEGTACPGNTPGTWSYCASILMLGGDYAGARQILEQHGSDLHQNHFDWTHLKQSYAIGLCYAMTGPARKNVELFEQFLNEPLSEDVEPEDFDELLQVVAASRELDPHPLAQPYYSDIETVVRQLRAYHAGEWVDLPFDEQLSGWYVNGVKVERLDASAVRLTSTAESLGVTLRPLAHFLPPFVCEAEITLADSSVRGKNFVGVIYGSPDRRGLYASHEPRGILLSPYQDIAVVFNDRSNEAVRNPPAWYIPQAESHLVRLKIWPEHVSYSVDHETVKTLESSQFPWSGRFTIGEQLPVAEVNSFVVRRPRIRRLEHGPPPATDDWDGRRTFYAAERELDPLDPSASYQLGRERYSREDYSGALEFFTEAQRLNLRYQNGDVNLGSTLLRLERLPEAIEHHERALQKQPDNVTSQTELALIRACAPDDALRNASQALSRAEAVARQTEYKQWYPLYALAAAQAESGRFDEARESLTKCLNLAPDSRRQGLEADLATLADGKPLRLKPRAPSTTTSSPTGSDPKSGV
jgi:hypothetical protein